jgi:hypothetical protein
MTPDPMTTMQSCYGDSCDCVPDEVIAIVDATLARIPGGEDRFHKRDARAAMIAPLMAQQGWRFCPCFTIRRTEQHVRIFDLVHTRLANRLANRALLDRVA